jgi:hypothetical protein
LIFKYANEIKNDFNISFKKFNKQIHKNKGTNISIEDFIIWVNREDELLNIQNKDIQEDWIYLENRIFADIANALWGKDYYYQMLLKEDNQFLTSLEHLNDAKALVD